MANLRIPLDYEEKQLHRSVWNLSQPVITTLMQCLNVPIKFEIMKPKDDFDIDYVQILQSMPMVGQLLNNWKLRIFCFKSDLSNYYQWMDNNSRLTTDQLKNRRHHFISPQRPGTESFKSKIYSKLITAHAPSYEAPINATTFFGVVPAVTTGSTVAFDYAKASIFAVHSDSVLDMIGLPRGYFSQTSFTSGVYDPANCFNADYVLTYLDSVRNYLVNNQYDAVPYMYKLPNLTAYGSDVATKWSGYIPCFNNLSLSQIDTFFRRLRTYENGTDLMVVCEDYNLDEVATWLCSLKFGGHFLAQYERDMLTGLLYKTSSDDVMISCDANGNFSINQLRFANRHQKKLDREDVGGGRWANQLRTVWGSKVNKKMDIPELVGVNSFTIDPRGVVTTANTYDEATGNGSSAGQLNGVVNTDSHSKFKHSVYSGDHSILMFMVQLVPEVVYSNGLGKGLDIRMFDDEYTPQFDQLGFQDVPFYKYNCLPRYDSNSGALYLYDSNSSPEFDKVVGKTIPFIDLISNVGRVHGKFASDEYFQPWVLVRTFDDDIEVPGHGDSNVVIGAPVENISPYANPLKYQYPFMAQGVDDPNFVFQFGLKMRAVRSKGKAFMPTLGE